ncbi:MAG TPA: ABC transporter substrate-binding protein [Methylomirabilota bacterium]|jgi:phospholipid transport system substrate-binding protein|nr:ABC transporter substrate-binding protein [Methylomirabilota bacterium]
MIRGGWWGVALAVSVVLLVGREAQAGLATDQLKGSIDRVVKALEDPGLKGDDKVSARRHVVRKVADDIFDFAEIARRSLARHWQPLTDQQRAEFINLFADLLERSYISKIELYGGEKILFTNERIDGEQATVATKIVTKNGTEVPIDYRLLKRGERWLVYDVNIEGVSLVSNYRTQFNKIIQTASYNELVQKMKSKQDELVSAAQGPQKKSTPAKK